jgi:CheY-like chemotaxis protein
MTNPHILLVESDVLVRKPLAEYLRDCGYKVVEALNTDEAVEVLTTVNAAIGIVLADVSSPGKIDGFGLANWMRSSARTARCCRSPTITRFCSIASKAKWRREREMERRSLASEVGVEREEQTMDCEEKARLVGD